MSVELKIKSKHLSEEARIIRFEEKKLKQRAQKARKKQQEAQATRLSFTTFRLNQHRRTVLRREARATFLARAFLAGRLRSEVEQSHRDPLSYLDVVDSVVRMVNSYGTSRVPETSVIEWFAEM